MQTSCWVGFIAFDVNQIVATLSWKQFYVNKCHIFYCFMDFKTSHCILIKWNFVAGSCITFNLFISVRGYNCTRYFLTGMQNLCQLFLWSILWEVSYDTRLRICQSHRQLYMATKKLGCGILFSSFSHIFIADKKKEWLQMQISFIAISINYHYQFEAIKNRPKFRLKTRSNSLDIHFTTKDKISLYHLKSPFPLFALVNIPYT